MRCDEKIKNLKNLVKVFFTGIICSLLISCNGDDDLGTQVEKKDLATVSFEVDASMLNLGVISKTITPFYTSDGFSIYAFKQSENGIDYEFSQMLNLSNAVYIPETKTLTGTATLEVGNYKFIPAYGLKNPQNLTLPIATGRSLSDDLSLVHSPTGNYGNNLPEVFLMTQDGATARMDDIQPYSVNMLGSLNQSVRLTVSRAVSRVDVMFIKAIKNSNNTYTEIQSAPQDVFGNLGLGKMEMRFTGLNQNMNLLGVKQAGVFNSTINAQNIGLNGDAVTMGTRNGASIIGAEDYFRFDSVQTNDVIRGSAHVFGSYLIPNNDDQRTVGLQLYVEPQNKITNSRSRTINIALGNERLIPLERNKVTLIKVYVLRDHLFGVDPVDPPGPPTIDPPGPPPIDPPGPPPVDPPGPEPDPDFAIEIQVIVNDVWDDSNTVDHNLD